MFIRLTSLKMTFCVSLLRASRYWLVGIRAKVRDTRYEARRQKAVCIFYYSIGAMRLWDDLDLNKVLDSVTAIDATHTILRYAERILTKVRAPLCHFQCIYLLHSFHNCLLWHLLSVRLSKFCAPVPNTERDIALAEYSNASTYSSKINKARSLF